MRPPDQAQLGGPHCVIATIIYAVITGILSFIPVIGWVLVLIVNPVFMIFIARYFSLVCDQGEPHQVTAAAAG